MLATNYATAPYSEVRNVNYSKTVESTIGFEKIATFITKKIMPLVESYRSKQITVRPVISVTGCSGVGKSYFSKKLSAYLHGIGINAKILKFDDFLDPGSVEGALNEIHPHFDHHKCHAFIQKILDGQEVIDKPAWSKTGPFKINQLYDLKNVELLIFEGEFTLCDGNTYDFLKFANLKVIIDANDDDIIRWDWERVRYFKPDSFAELTKLKIKSLANYRKLLDSLRHYADFIINKKSDHEFVLNL